MAEAFHSIGLDLGDGVATLALRRPERVHSFIDARRAESRQALDSQLDPERDLQRELGRSADYRGGRQRFPRETRAGVQG